MNNNYTAQAILAMATRDETRALENYFGPQWVYQVLKDEESSTRYGLKYEANVVELRESKRAAREAWESIKRDIDKMAALGLTQETTIHQFLKCEECGDDKLADDTGNGNPGWWRCACGALHRPGPDIEAETCSCRGPKHDGDCIHYQH